nr:hypothetical protein [Tanacetum cinerariifolium]
MVKAADHRSTVVVNDGRRWRTTVDCRWTTVNTTGPPVNGGWWAGQRAGLGRSGSGLGRVRVGSGSGSGRVRHVSATCAHVSATCAHVASTWQLTLIISTRRESNSGPHGWNLSQNQENHYARITIE